MFPTDISCRSASGDQVQPRVFSIESRRICSTNTHARRLHGDFNTRGLIQIITIDLKNPWL